MAVYLLTVIPVFLRQAQVVPYFRIGKIFLQVPQKLSGGKLPVPVYQFFHSVKRVARVNRGNTLDAGEIISGASRRGAFSFFKTSLKEHAGKRRGMIPPVRLFDGPEIRYQMRKLRKGSTVIAQLLKDRKLALVGGVFDLATGAVKPVEA